MYSASTALTALVISFSVAVVWPVAAGAQTATDGARETPVAPAAAWSDPHAERAGVPVYRKIDRAGRALSALILGHR